MGESLRVKALLFFGAGLSIAQAAPCPKTSAEWETRRDTLIAKISRDNNPTDWGETAAGELKVCQEKAHPDIRACLARTLSAADYLIAVNRLDPKDPSSAPASGRKIGHKEYFEKHKAELMPPDVYRSDAFLRLIKPWSDDKLPAIEKYVEKWNLERKAQGLEPIVVLPYESTQASNDDYRSLKRLLFYDPGSPKDPVKRFLQFIPDGQLLSVVAVKEVSPGKFESYLRDTFTGREGFPEFGNQTPVFTGKTEEEEKAAEEAYFAKRRAAPMTVHYTDYEVGGSNRCSACHIHGGPMPIFPRVPLTGKYEEARKQLNGLMRTFGDSRSPDEIRLPEGFPSLGDGDFTAETILTCADKIGDVPSAQVDEKIRQKVAGAMNCVSCHDGNDRLPIRGYFSLANPGIFDVISKGHMPPNHNLSQAEISALYTCLYKSYWGKTDESTREHTPGAIEKWMREVPCRKPGSESSEPGADDETH